MPLETNTFPRSHFSDVPFSLPTRYLSLPFRHRLPSRSGGKERGKMNQRKEGRELTGRGFGGHLQSSAEHVEHVEAGLQARLKFIAETSQTVHQLAVPHLQGLDFRLRHD